MKHIVVCLGDTHCGSTVGLCPPEGLELDDEGLYLPSKAQLWLWNNWEEAWAKIKSVKRKNRKAKQIIVFKIDSDRSGSVRHQTSRAYGKTGTHQGSVH